MDCSDDASGGVTVMGRRGVGVFRLECRYPRSRSWGCVGTWSRFMPKVERSVVSMAEIVVFLYSPVVSIRHSLPEPHPTCRC